MGAAGWTHRNLETQGYRLTPEQSRALAVGLRFPTALCLGLVTPGLALESAPMLAGLAVIGAVAGLSPRHPFDHLWNHGVRHLFGAPPVPPNPARRRHAFKVATGWLLAVAGLLAAGATAAGIVAGVLLLAACAAVTVFNYCMPSTVLAAFERSGREVRIT